MFAGLGIWEMILIFLVILLLFGAKRLPEIGSSLGKGIREFKGSLREIEHEINISDDESKGQVTSSKTNEDEEEGNPRRLTPSP
jgi:TatA/E family protein of Tat protein translocase